MAPKVSICIPAYNQPELLNICLNSIEQQSFQDFEIVISDDSSDNSIENLVNNSALREKIIYVKNNPSLGSPKNWNQSIELAKGSLIKILHHDDFFTSENSLKEFVDFFEKNPDTELLFCATQIKNLKENKIITHQISDKEFNSLKKNPELLFHTNLIGSPSVIMFRKNDSILFNEQLKWLVDVEWYYRLIINKIKFAYLPKTLIGTHHAFEGQTTQEVQKQKAIQIKEHVLMFQSIYHSITNFSVFNLYFEILFNKYGIKNWEDLTSIITPEKEFNKYFKDRIYKSNSFIFFKKILFWYKKRGAKVIFEYFKSKLK